MSYFVMQGVRLGREATEVSSLAKGVHTKNSAQEIGPLRRVVMVVNAFAGCSRSGALSGQIGLLLRRGFGEWMCMYESGSVPRQAPRLSPSSAEQAL